MFLPDFSAGHHFSLTNKGNTMDDSSNVGHTPGPWTAKNSPGAGLEIWADLRAALGEKFSKDFPIYGFHAAPAPKVQIAYETWVQFPSEEWAQMQEANARLIAAAPELLNAVQAFIDYDKDGFDEEDHAALMIMYADALRLSKAAVAKATGAA